MVFDNICTPNKTSRNSKLFYEGKGKLNFIVATVKKSWAHWITGSTLLLFIVSNMFFNITHFRSHTTLTMSLYTQILFSWTDNGKWSRNYSFWNLSLTDLDPKPEKLCEHGPVWRHFNIRCTMFHNQVDDIISHAIQHLSNIVVIIILC